MGHKYMSIRELAHRGPLTEYALRQLHRDNQLPGITIGCKFLVNIEQYDQMLDAMSAAAVHGQDIPDTGAKIGGEF